MKSSHLSGLVGVGLGVCLSLQAQDSGVGAHPPAVAAKDDGELIKELQNPVADLISIPVENRLDVGAGKAQRYNMTIMPVLPFELTSDLLMVSRTVLPVIHDTGAAVGGSSQTGLGDLTQSFFFAPRKITSGLIYGAGPVLRLPTATDRSLGMGAWAAGPTAVVLYQGGAWTFGALANHAWSFAGRPGSRFNGSLVMPFVAYTTRSFSTFGLSSESVYDWVTRTHIIPIDATFSRLVRAGATPINVAVGARKYLSRPAGGADWGAICTLTFLLSR